MSAILSISASPQPISSTHALVGHINRRLLAAGHTVRTLSIRTLPATPLLAGDVSHPALTDAIRAVRDADALIVATPVYQSAYSGLLKVFLDLLPQFALRGKTVLPLATGGSSAHVLAVDYALRPVLSALGAAHVTPGWFVPTAHIHVFPDGGVLLDAASLAPIAQVTEEFLATLAGRPDRVGVLPRRVDVAAGPRVSSVVGAPGLTVHRLDPSDPRLQPLLTDLLIEYGTRYGTEPTDRLGAAARADDFLEPDGCFLVLAEDGETVAGGALHRHDPITAAVENVWTSHRHRRRGLGLRVLAELESVAAQSGYRRIRATTGPRQPEAGGLYREAGYASLFDVTADPETVGTLVFAKELATDGGSVVSRSHRFSPSLPHQQGALLRV